MEDNVGRAPKHRQGASCGFSVELLVACLRPSDPPVLPPSAPKDARFERLACLCRPFSSNPSTCHPVEFPACDPSEVWPRCCRYLGPHSCADGLALGRSRHSFTVVWRAVHPWAFFSLFTPSRMQGARIHAVAAAATWNWSRNWNWSSNSNWFSPSVFCPPDT